MLNEDQLFDSLKCSLTASCLGLTITDEVKDFIQNLVRMKFSGYVHLMTDPEIRDGAIDAPLLRIVLSQYGLNQDYYYTTPLIWRRNNSEAVSVQEKFALDAVEEIARNFPEESFDKSAPNGSPDDCIRFVQMFFERREFRNTANELFARVFCRYGND